MGCGSATRSFQMVASRRALTVREQTKGLGFAIFHRSAYGLTVGR